MSRKLIITTKHRKKSFKALKCCAWNFSVVGVVVAGGGVIFVVVFIVFKYPSALSENISHLGI